MPDIPEDGSFVTGTIPVKKSSTPGDWGATTAGSGSGTVTSVAATDGTIVVGGTPTVAPTVGVGLVTVPKGGTGLTTLTAHGVLLGEGTSAIAATAAGTAGQPLLSGGASADPAFAATLAVANGGTGAATLTNHGVVIGQATSAVAATSAGTAGQVLTSNGPSADPTFQAVSGSGVASGSPAITGVWYRPGYQGSAGFTTQDTINVLRARRVYLNAGTLVRTGVYLQSTATASEVIRTGLYADSNGRPGALSVDGGTISIASGSGLLTNTISLVVTTGYYWLAAVRQGPSVLTVLLTFPSATNQGVESPGGWVEFDGTSIHSGSQWVASASSTASGALPDPFGTLTMGNDNGAFPIVGWRY